MKGDVILAHDLGTTGNKASIYDTNGKLIKSHYYPYETFYPCQNCVEQNPEDWWRAFVLSTKEVISSAELDHSQILGLSFSGQMMAGIPVDMEGNVLQKNVFLWADHRSKAQAEFIKDKIGWSTFYHTTGGGMEIPLYPIAKILWLKENDPDTYNKTYRFLGAKDFLVNRLTGRFVTDFSDASNTGLLDLNRRSWASDMLKEIGIDQGKLCEEIYPSTSIAGHVTRNVSQETGLKEGTPVILGGGDVACAALGAGVIKEGLAYNYIGSASWLAISSSRSIFEEKMRPFTLCHVVPGMYVVQLATFSAGVVYAWLRDQMCWLEKAYAECSGKDPFDLINQEAVNSVPGAHGLVFLPNLRPGGAPHNNLKDHGALLGLTLAHTKGDIIRAALEGITFNIRLMCEAMERQAGFPFQEIRFIGGGSKSPLWCEIEASILNKKIITLSAQQEANSLGAAIVAGVSLGVFESFEKATQQFIRPQETIPPNDEMNKVYEKVFPIFNRAYAALVAINEEISDMAAQEMA